MSTQVDWFGPDVYVPWAHTVHAWSLAALPTALTYSPATHEVQAVHAAALLLVL
jgi:hypothetical protein